MDLDRNKPRTICRGSRTRRGCWRRIAPMIAVSANPSMGLLFRGTTFPVNTRKIPCSEGISAGASGICCFLLHFGNGIARYQGVGRDLFRFRARVRARARGTGATGGMQRDGGGRRARYAAIPPALAAGMISPKEREMARSSGTRGADKRPRPRCAMCASTSRMSAQRRTG